MANGTPPAGTDDLAAELLAARCLPSRARLDFTTES
jgi:hypothetical protein